MDKGHEHSHEISLSSGDCSLEMLLFPITDIDSVFLFTHYSHLYSTCYTLQLGVQLYMLIGKLVPKDGSQKKNKDSEVKTSMWYSLSYLF